MSVKAYVACSNGTNLARISFVLNALLSTGGTGGVIMEHFFFFISHNDLGNNSDQTCFKACFVTHSTKSKKQWVKWASFPHGLGNEAVGWDIL